MLEKRHGNFKYLECNKYRINKNRTKHKWNRIITFSKNYFKKLVKINKKRYNNNISYVSTKKKKRGAIFMEIKVTGKELKITDAINDYIERKMDRIEKYFENEKQK